MKRLRLSRGLRIEELYERRRTGSFRDPLKRAVAGELRSDQILTVRDWRNVRAGARLMVACTVAADLGLI
jgi:hypothetical protein